MAVGPWIDLAGRKIWFASATTDVTGRATFPQPGGAVPVSALVFVSISDSSGQYFGTYQIPVSDILVDVVDHLGGPAPSGVVVDILVITVDP